VPLGKRFVRVFAEHSIVFRFTNLGPRGFGIDHQVCVLRGYRKIRIDRGSISSGADVTTARAEGGRLLDVVATDIQSLPMLWSRSYDEERVAQSFLVAAGLLAVLSGYSVYAQMNSEHSGPVMNYHRVNERLVTGGHLLDGGTAVLKEQGVKVVIDLRDEPPSGEKERFAEQGIQWINIPVEWSNPQKADFERFRASMREHQQDHVLVQCAANYRASAMTYLYRVVVEKVPDDEAEEDLRAVWNPGENDTWSEFIGDIKAASPR